MLKAEIINTAITHYQVIENMERKNYIGIYKEIPYKTRLIAGSFYQEIRSGIHHPDKN
ncbi:MAG: hypothetical protein KatS3mg089_0756 [Patescibacteria group bacterium]|nr:MAG: hypothetical protein KatS3mg089_0756 [Patescibacteria group bacterium]